MKRCAGWSLLVLICLTTAGILYPEEALRWSRALFARSTTATADDPPAEPSAAVKALVEALQDKDAEVRKNAAQSLGRIGKEARAAVRPLAAALKDSDVDGALDGDLDRFMIAQLLALAGDPSAAPMAPTEPGNEDDI